MSTSSLDSARARIDRLAAEHDATISVWMGSLRGEPWLVRDAEVEHPAASTLKLPLLIAVYAAAESGELDVAEPLFVHSDFASVVVGATYTITEEYDNDPQPWELLGERATIGWLAERAIVLSSNLATNLLIERVGLDAVNAVYDAAGESTSRLRRGIQDDPASEAGIVNTATAADLASVLNALIDDRLTEHGTTRRVERILAACQTNEAIPAGLPADTYVAHKTGWIEGACHDVAIVRPVGEEPFILSIYTGADLGDAALHGLVSDVARSCWDHRPRVGR